MKIEIGIPTNFIPERQYAIKVLFDTLLGIDYEVIPRVGIKDYIIRVSEEKKLIIQDHFFSTLNEAEGYLDKKYLPTQALLSNYENNLPEAVIIFGTNYFAQTEENTVLGLDVFASGFFMLSRWEEAVLDDSDTHQRFPHQQAFAYQKNFLHRPVVNEYAELLRKVLLLSGYQGEFNNQEFKLIPTHDVDHIRYWKTAQQMKRQVGGDVLKRNNPFLAFKTYKEYQKVSKGIIKDPYDTFDFLMIKSEEAGLQSHFYFIAGGKTEHEGNYDIRSKEVKKLIQEIKSRGHIIGIHPSYDTYLDVEMLKSEMRIIEEIAGQQIEEGRQHYLRFAVPETWQNWEDAGLKVDSSMNFAGYEGYRCGIGSEFPVFNVKTRKELKLIERPLILMDANPLIHQFDNINKTYPELITYFIEQARKHKMPFTVLFHNSVFAMYKRFRLEDVYNDLFRKI